VSVDRGEPASQPPIVRQGLPPLGAIEFKDQLQEVLSWPPLHDEDRHPIDPVDALWLGDQAALLKALQAVVLVETVVRVQTRNLSYPEGRCSFQEIDLVGSAERRRRLQVDISKPVPQIRFDRGHLRCSIPPFV